MKKKILYVAFGGAAVLIAFLVYFLLRGNFEFIGYAFVVGLLLFALFYSDKYVNYPASTFWIFIGWIFLHFSGGAFYFNGKRLYDIVLIDIIGDPFFILKYDQFVHAYCYFAISILIYFISIRYFNKRSFTVYILIILSSIGVGAINEIIEFGMVIWLDAGEAVGGYYNTLMDIVMNLVGAVIGVYFAKAVYRR